MIRTRRQIKERKFFCILSMRAKKKYLFRILRVGFLFNSWVFIFKKTIDERKCLLLLLNNSTLIKRIVEKLLLNLFIMTIFLCVKKMLIKLIWIFLKIISNETQSKSLHYLHQNFRLLFTLMWSFCDNSRDNHWILPEMSIAAENLPLPRHDGL